LEIFSNIELIILKNTLRCPLYGITNEKIQKILSRLVRPQKNRKVDGDRCNIASYEKNTNDLLKFLVPKNFKLSVYNLLIEF
jgi:hypothetical protein